MKTGQREARICCARRFCLTPSCPVGYKPLFFLPSVYPEMLGKGCGEAANSRGAPQVGLYQGSRRDFLASAKKKHKNGKRTAELTPFPLDPFHNLDENRRQRTPRFLFASCWIDFRRTSRKRRQVGRQGSIAATSDSPCLVLGRRPFLPSISLSPKTFYSNACIALRSDCIPTGSDFQEKAGEPLSDGRFQLGLFRLGRRGAAESHCESLARRCFALVSSPLSCCPPMPAAYTPRARTEDGRWRRTAPLPPLAPCQRVSL